MLGSQLLWFLRVPALVIKGDISLFSCNWVTHVKITFEGPSLKCVLALDFYTNSLSSPEASTYFSLWDHNAFHNFDNLSFSAFSYDNFKMVSHSGLV